MLPGRDAVSENASNGAFDDDVVSGGQWVRDLNVQEVGAVYPVHLISAGGQWESEPVKSAIISLVLLVHNQLIDIDEEANSCRVGGKLHDIVGVETSRSAMHR